MEDFNQIKDTLPEASASTSKKPFKKRGAGSQAKRKANFYGSKNADAQELNRRRLKDQLDPSDIQALSESLKRDYSFGEKKLVAIPFTTRGIGFHTFDFMRYVASIVSTTVRVDLSPFYVYRTSLLQLDRQLTSEVALRNIDFDVEIPIPSISWRSIRTIERRNYKFIVECINQIGDFNDKGVDYFGYIPQPIKGRRAVHHYLDVDMPDVAYQPESPDPNTELVSAKRQRVSGYEVRYNAIDIPDPFHITIRNLRRTCELLASRTTPLNYRQFFISRNPIPGAIFDDDSLLTNMEEIIPHNYMNSHVLDQDLAKFVILLNLVGVHDSSAIKQLSLNGNGSPVALNSQTTAAEDAFCIRGDVESGYIISPKTVFRGYCNIDDNQRLRGLLSLMNEYPYIPDTDAALYTGFAIRQPHLATHSMVARWHNLVSQVSVSGSM